MILLKPNFLSESVSNVMYIMLIFLCGSLLIFGITRLAPMNSSTEGPISFPNNIEDLRTLSIILKKYYEKHYCYIILLFCTTYLYKQSFMIPGSALLNILAGALFGTSIALPLCCILTAVGATCSYMLSKYFGKSIIEQMWGDKVNALKRKILDNEENLFYYLLFLRLFPMSPNWLINLMCPVVGVPLDAFFLSIIIGLIPYNFVCVQAGDMLSNISSLDEIFTTKIFLRLSAMALAALGPSLLMKKNNSRV